MAPAHTPAGPGARAPGPDRLGHTWPVADADTRILLDDVVFPECPRWRAGRLWFSDFFAHRVRTVAEDGVSEDVCEVPRQPAGLGWLPDGRLLVVSMVDRRLLRLEPDGALVPHADLRGVATFHANDLVTDGAGRAYVGSYGFDAGGGAPAVPATLALVHPDGRVEATGDPLEFPNGMAIADGGATLLVAETLGRRISALPIGADGRLGRRRTWASLAPATPDGICLDAAGGLWVAVTPERACIRVGPDGRITDRVSTHRPCVACALGGADGRTLFLTTSDFAVVPPVPGDHLGRIEATRVHHPAA